MVDRLTSVPEIDYKHSMFESVEAIRLEMTDHSIIGEVSQVELTDRYIFILDKKSHALLMFDRSGAFLRTISSHGQGPKEYLDISTFYIVDETIRVIDPMKKQIMVYDFKGQYITAIPSSSNHLSFLAKVKPLEGNRAIGHTSINWCEGGYFLFENENMDEGRQLYDYQLRSDNWQAFHFSSQPTCTIGNEVRWIKPFSDTVYTYREHQIVPTYILQRHRKPIEHSRLIQKQKEAKGSWAMLYADIIKNHTYSPGIKNIMESERYLYLEFYHDSLIPSAIIWDKKEKNGMYIAQNISDSPTLSSLIYSRGNERVRIWGNEIIPSFKEKKDKTSLLPASWQKLLKGHSEEENPILLIFKVRE